MSPDEDKILSRVLNLNGLYSLQMEVFNHILELILLEVADPESDVIFLHEHLVAFEDVTLPEVFLELWEGIEYL